MVTTKVTRQAAQAAKAAGCNQKSWLVITRDINPYWESMTFSSARAHGNAMAREALAKTLGA